ncbi:MAG: Slp family lipoprotein [Methylococcaceae bacterium]
MRWLLFSIALIFLNGCSDLPKAMKNGSYTDAGLNTVKADFASYMEMPFLWGGKIINVTNKEDLSQVQLLFYPLNGFDKPQITVETEGRFMMSATKFLDPAVYKEGVEVTVLGVLTGKIKQQVGEKTLTLPVLSIKHIHLWPDRRQYDNGYYLQSPYYFPRSHYRYDYYYDWYY